MQPASHLPNPHESMLRRTELNASMITIYPCIKKECNLLHVYQWMIDDIIHVYDVQCSKIAS